MTRRRMPRMSLSTVATAAAALALALATGGCACFDCPGRSPSAQSLSFALGTMSGRTFEDSCETTRKLGGIPAALGREFSGAGEAFCMPFALRAGCTGR